MILLNPWALIGLLAIAGPIAAHLLGRRQARRLAFPNLRFLPATVPSPVSRDRISDVWLLALRIAVIAGAAIAMAQPVWVSPARARHLGSQVARAVIVDASASMSRPAGRGVRTPRPAGRDVETPSASTVDGRAIDEARKQAVDAAAGATMSRIVEAAELASTIPAAVNWLLAQPMRRELTIVSDFQTSALTSADVEKIPAGVGVRLVQIPAAGAVPPAAVSRDRLGPLHPTSAREVGLLAGAADRERAEAARAAAIAAGAPTLGADSRPTAIVFAGFEARAELRRRVLPLDAPWMSESFSRVTRDALVVAAAARTGNLPLELIDAGGDPDTPGRLLIFLDAAPHTLLAASVIGSVLRAVAVETPAAESAPDSYAPEELRRWERPSLDVTVQESSRGQSWSDARWLWLAVLLLLIVESLIRRRRAAVEAQRHALVA